MIYNIYEFVIEEKLVDKDDIQKMNEQTALTFPVELRERLIEALNRQENKYISYSIKKDGVYVGEITFKILNQQQPEIGIVLEEAFQRQGIGYRLITALMERYKKDNKVDFFIYKAYNNNIGSNALAKKLGGELVDENIILTDLNFSLNTYYIR